MTSAQERRFTRMLLRKSVELGGEIEARQSKLSVECAGDPLDHVQQLADREMAARELDQLSAQLKSVHGALNELREGTFGNCASCGRRIPPKRLELVPWSPHCVHCQEEAERGQPQGDAEHLRARLVA